MDFNWNFRFVRVGAFQQSFLSYQVALAFFFVHRYWILPRSFQVSTSAIYANNDSIYIKGGDPMSFTSDNIFNDGYSVQLCSLTKTVMVVMKGILKLQ